MTNGADESDLADDPNELTVWFERLDPLQVRTYDDAPIRDDYSNIYFVGTGKSRAHAGRPGRRPDCIPADAPAHWSHDLWAGELPPAIPRCADCAKRHPRPSPSASR
ncbi:hypothetical protein BJY16_005236 [Actinoplanes octamycinicus]|uniref:Uncharacterized protein n=1 Tax=Actinoplanes octamycinicus TaxID=135948 RepID=A0A7W7H0S4_9ACTN|nr:hypothetical protein [Actinoplanes octamycinicus]MBB4741777.1 hypothetical protein [Actinoplanes octamycinicus]GIE57334.1 hypothetical protein Aoc01nite_27360 [Actinoplanes octamycinicus]